MYSINTAKDELTSGINTTQEAFRAVLIPYGSPSAWYYYCMGRTSALYKYRAEVLPRSINTARK